MSAQVQPTPTQPLTAGDWIRARYWLIQPRTRVPTQSQKLKTISQELAANLNAEPNSINVTAAGLFAKCPATKKLLSHVYAFKSWCREISHPWHEQAGEEGTRLQGPRAILDDYVSLYLQRMRDDTMELENMKDAYTETTYVEELGDAQSRAKQKFGDAAKDIRWPTREQLLDSIQIVWVMPWRMPAGTEAGAGNLTMDVVAAIDQINAETTKVKMRNAFNDRVELLREKVNTYQRQLGPEGMLYESVRQSIERLCDDSVLEMAAILEHPHQEAMRQVLPKLKQIAAEPTANIKKSEDLRKGLAEAMTVVDQYLAMWPLAA